MTTKLSKAVFIMIMKKKKKTAWSAYTFYLYESLTQPDNEQVLYSVLAE